jgi:hypothetical protein
MLCGIVQHGKAQNELLLEALPRKRRVVEPLRGKPATCRRR